MFESQLALEKAQGHRGLATRLFAPVTNRAEAEILIRETTLALFGVACIFLLAAFKASILNLVIAAGVGLPALLLFATRARPAAVLLCISVLVCSVLYVLGGAHGLLLVVMPVLLGGFAVRASMATFRRHSFPPPLPEPPVAFSPPVGPAG